MEETNAGDPRIGVTNNESAATKHLVQPYADTPVVSEVSDRTCAYCGNAGFRRSRLRFNDLLHLVTLKLPVRCTRCGQRQHVAFGLALQAQPVKPQNPGPSPDKPGSWKAFTAEVPETLSHAHPARTAAEPVAQRLDDAFKPGPPAHLGAATTPQNPVPFAPPVQRPADTAQPQNPLPRRIPSRRNDDSGIW